MADIQGALGELSDGRSWSMIIPAYDVQGSSWDMATLPSGPLAELHAYWQSKRAGRPWPSRADIDPLDIPLLLKYLLLIEVERLEPMRIRFRLVGTNFRQFYGRDLTGLTRDETELKNGPEQGLAAMMADWREVLQRGAPRWASVRQKVGRDGLDWVRFTGLALPLAREGTPHPNQAADMIMLCTVYHPDEATSGGAA
ncbi:PAS domain-containing protein [Ferrovibrio sp.]|jgi:hypothetical protein|uniref:PAS domain-containing protein n=1 Tax=Ferrovibrio sp. TaxID=1917215 RepID=UPI0035AFF32D